MNKRFKRVVFFFGISLIFSSIENYCLIAQEKTITNPVSDFFRDLIVEIDRAIKANYTRGELEFIETHHQIFFPAEEHPNKEIIEGQSRHLKIFSEWVAADCGDVDMMFPMLIQVVSVTQMNNEIDKPKKLQLQKIIEFPALKGGVNVFTWTRVDSQGDAEKLEFTGVFRIKTKEGGYGLIRAFRALELHEGIWKTVKKDFQWIQKLQ